MSNYDTFKKWDKIEPNENGEKNNIDILQGDERSQAHNVIIEEDNWKAVKDTTTLAEGKHSHSGCNGNHELNLDCMK